MPSLSVYWRDVELAQVVDRLEAATASRVFLDRRVNPSLRVTLSATDQPLPEIVAELSDRLNLEASAVGQLIYIGPAGATRDLATLAALKREGVNDLPSRAKANLGRAKSIHWERLAEPAVLIQQQLRESGLRPQNAAEIPHDLWPAGSLPEMTLAERLTVLLYGFDLTYEVAAGGRELRLVPIMRPIAMERRFTWSGRRAVDVAEFQRQHPDAQVDLEGDSLVLRGSIEAVDALSALMEQEQQSANRRRAARRSVRRGNRRGEQRRVYTLHVEQQPLRPVLEQLARQLQMELHFDEGVADSSNASLEQRVSFSVDSVDLDGLLEAALAPAGLSYRLEDRRLLIVPAGGTR